MLVNIWIYIRINNPKPIKTIFNKKTQYPKVKQKHIK